MQTGMVMAELVFVVFLLFSKISFNQQLTSEVVVPFELFMKRTGRLIDHDMIRKGLAYVNWPGRLQIIHEKPLVLIDGAHNEEGIKTKTGKKWQGVQVMNVLKG